VTYIDDKHAKKGGGNWRAQLRLPGRAVQAVDFKTCVESAYGFSA
jgi:hypothetical protein